MTEQSGGNHEVEGSSDRCSKRRKLESVVPGGSADLIQIFQRDHGRIRGRRGRLKLMTEMPFDILYEIFGELEPIDLLHLSWSTRTLHGMIMGKDGRFLWKNVLYIISCVEATCYLLTVCLDRLSQGCTRQITHPQNVLRISILPSIPIFSSERGVWYDTHSLLLCRESSLRLGLPGKPWPQPILGNEAANLPALSAL